MSIRLMSAACGLGLGRKGRSISARKAIGERGKDSAVPSDDLRGSSRASERRGDALQKVERLGIRGRCRARRQEYSLELKERVPSVRDRTALAQTNINVSYAK
ncbi:hypothetical protein C2E23DRAFT_815191 [Lenzites betulinus]|nr:hypothetical protein C2E23DRAFT_815191 [Lenzites betulinus]